MGSGAHNFRESLERSKAYEDAPWWMEVYSAAFKDLRAAVSVRNDGWAQRGGIDRVLTLASGKTLNVDEKVREKAWPDVLLELYSDEEKKTLGWAAKPLACDFIAYAYVETQECLLLPFQTMQRAFRLNYHDWRKKADGRAGGFRWVRADNGNYDTLCIAIPKSVLREAIADALTVSWGPA